MSTAPTQFGLFDQPPALVDPLVGQDLTAVEAFLVRALKSANSKQPVLIADLLAGLDGELNVTLDDRSAKQAIRRLRRLGAPILARRTKPAGLWWARCSSEMSDFIRSWPAWDELKTIRAMMVSFPELAGQLRFDLEADTTVD